MTRKKITIHLHHISSHLTNGLFPASSLMITLFLLTGNTLYESTAFHCVIIGLLAAPAVFGSGAMDWKKRFNGRRTRIFNHKIIFGLLLLFLGILTVLIRISFAGSWEDFGVLGWVYIALIYLLTAITAYLGHLGGKFI